MGDWQTLAWSLAATWIGAVGVGAISVGLRLNNALQRLTAIVERLEREHRAHDADIRILYEARLGLAERLARIEQKYANEEAA